MGAKKEIDVGKYNAESDDLSRPEQIEQALEEAKPLDRDEIAQLATMLNVLTATGKHVPTSAESQSLRSLTTKFIPDAPKEVHLKAEIKTEQVIMSWLEQNGELATLAEQRAISQSPIQDAHYEVLEGFAEEIRGEVVSNGGEDQ